MLDFQSITFMKILELVERCLRNKEVSFQNYLIKSETGETLVVTKLDRLGRDVVDILTTIRYLTSRNIEVIVLQLG